MEKYANLLFKDKEYVDNEERWEMGSNLSLFLKNGLTAFFTNVVDVQIQGPLMIIFTSSGENSIIPMNVIASGTNHKGKEPKDLEWQKFEFEDDEDDS